MHMLTTHATYQERAYIRKAGHQRLTDAFYMSARLYNAAKERWQKAYDAYRCEEQRWLIDNDEPDGEDKKLLQRDCAISLYDHMKDFTQLRKEDEFWGSVDTKVGRGVLRRLDRARNAFYRRCKAGETPGYPKWKAGRRWKTIEVNNPTPGMVTRKRGKLVVKVKGLPKLRIRPSRALPPSHCLKTLTITRKPNGVYASLGYEVEKEALPKTDRIVGIDMGVRSRMALSDGREIERRRIADVAPLQQRIARCNKNSGNQRKLYRQLAKMKHWEVVRNRNDCHRITTDLIRAYDLIGVEELGISRMTRSARGTVEKPGKNVAAKAGLNRAISEQAWGMLLYQLEYKAGWYGKQFVAINPQYTSQTCHSCGHVDKGSRDGKRYHCSRCGYECDADLNAARNILQRAAVASGAKSSPGLRAEKQRVGRASDASD